MRGCMTWFSFDGSCARCTTAAAEQAVTYASHQLFHKMLKVLHPASTLICCACLACAHAVTWHVMPSMLDRQGHNRV